MKRITGLLVLALFLAVPTLALAAEQMGVYVTPKFVYGYTAMKGTKGEIGHEWPSINYRGTLIKGDTHDHAWGGALAVGYDVNKKFRVPVRTELEYAAFSNVTGKTTGFDQEGFYDTVKQKLRIQTLFVNAYYDFRNRTAFTPYIGGGLGLAFINAKGRGSYEGDIWHWNGSGWYEANGGSARAGSRSTTNFAWNIGAGVAYDITNWCSVDFNYRFTGLGNAESKWSLVSQLYDNSFRVKTKNIYMHQVLTAVRFTF